MRLLFEYREAELAHSIGPKLELGKEVNKNESGGRPRRSADEGGAYNNARSATIRGGARACGGHRIPTFLLKIQ